MTRLLIALWTLLRLAARRYYDRVELRLRCWRLARLHTRLLVQREKVVAALARAKGPNKAVLLDLLAGVEQLLQQMSVTLAMAKQTEEAVVSIRHQVDGAMVSIRHQVDEAMAKRRARVTPL